MDEFCTLMGEVRLQQNGERGGARRPGQDPLWLSCQTEHPPNTLYPPSLAHPGWAPSSGQAQPSSPAGQELFENDSWM